MRKTFFLQLHICFVVDYLVFNSKCRIPNYDVFSDEIKQFYRPEKYFPCNQHPLLTYVTKNDNKTSAILHIDHDLVSSYSKNGVACCYSIVTRKRYPDGPDDGIEYAITNNFLSCLGSYNVKRMCT